MESIDARWLERFRRNLRAWYGRNARKLPWRETHDPYAIWISEIMLQQTTVAAVVPYYERFLNRFPTVADLAAAKEEEVLRLWEGLGYYSRARNIHKTARKVVHESDGQFPEEVGELVILPGIGRYTAGAIASFAFDRRAPIVEANTLRLYCRLLGYRGDPRSTAGQRTLWEFAERILPRKLPGRFNQALMELGATVCTPTEPNCPRCPVRTCCQAFAECAQDEIPRPPARPEVTEVTEASVAVMKNGKFLLRRRSADERWAGLWDFPRFEVDGVRTTRRNGDLTAALKRTAETAVAELTGIEVRVDRLLTELRHGVTRFRIRLLCLSAEHRSGSLGRRQDMRWLKPTDFGEYPLSVTGRKLARFLSDEITGR